MYNLLAELLESFMTANSNERVESERLPLWSHSENIKSCSHSGGCCNCKNDTIEEHYFVKETENAYELYFTDDFTGYKVDLEYEDYKLKLTATKEEDNKSTKITYEMSLPQDINNDANKIEAKNMEGNRIMVSLPKAQNNNKRKIEIR